MKNRGIKKHYNARSPLRKKLIIIEALVFLIPVLVVAYIYYQKYIYPACGSMSHSGRDGDTQADFRPDSYGPKHNEEG